MAFWQETRQNTAFDENHSFHDFCDYLLSLLIIGCGELFKAI